MSSALTPCPACNRHVFADACACPFCATQLRVCEASREASPGAQLSRAVRLAAGAALVGVAACTSTSVVALYGAPPFDGGSLEAGADGGAGGAPSTDAGGAGGSSDAGGAGGSSDTGGAGGTSSPPDAGADRTIVPIYGAAAPVQRKPVP